MDNKMDNNDTIRWKTKTDKNWTGCRWGHGIVYRCLNGVHMTQPERHLSIYSVYLVCSNQYEIDYSLINMARRFEVMTRI